VKLAIKVKSPIFQFHISGTIAHLGTPYARTVRSIDVEKESQCDDCQRRLGLHRFGPCHFINLVDLVKYFQSLEMLSEMKIIGLLALHCICIYTYGTTFV
jgi:hypothetical protein